MKKRLFVAFSLATVFVLVVGGAAMAASPDAGMQPGARPGVPGLGLPPGGWRIFNAVARALDMTPTELFEAFHSGQTLPEIAKAQGVGMAKIRGAIRVALRPPLVERLFWLPRGGWAVYDAVADALGMTPTELFEALHSGQSLPEIAESQGVEMNEIREAAQAARESLAREAILDALEEGKITQEHADWMIEGLENGWRFPPHRR